METIQFIGIEDEDPDLVLSFALDDQERGVKSLILQRTPAYENILPAEERSVHVSMEFDEDLENNRLEEISIKDGVITISASKTSYELDISRIGKEELEEMSKFIEKLNFDSSIKVSIA